MKQKTVSNLLSEHRLSNSTLDFLELIKSQEYHLDTPEDFEIISHVNNSPDMIKKIFGSYYEVGFCETFDLNTSSTKTEEFMHFDSINKKRKSIRSFGEMPITFENLSNFLKLFYSITGEEEFKFKDEKIIRQTRNIASGGAIYPTEIFIINNRIEEIPKGAYRYNVYTFQLECILKLETETEMQEFYKLLRVTEGSTSIDYINASAFILFTSVLNKHSFKYQDFGVVLSLLEMGEFIHSAYLAAATTNMGCCLYGGILSDKINKFLDLKNPLHFPVVSMALGTLKKTV